MNKALLIGRLTKDPEVNYNPQTQMAVARFTLAIDDGYGEKKRTNFPNCVAFGKTAENMSQFCVKGSQVGVEGKIQTGSYKKQDGTTVYTTDVIADRVEFLTKAQGVKPTVETTTQSSIADNFEALNEDVPF